MKRIICCIMILLLVVSLTGCAASGIRLTDEESDAIAQYSAYLIMKYDKRQNADFKLLEHKEYEELKKENQEEALPSLPPDEVNPTEEPVATEEVKPTETPSGNEAGTVTETPENDGGDTPDITGKPIDSGNEIPDIALNDVFNTKNFEMTFTGYEKSKVYKNVLSSPEGKEILVLNFDIKNVSAEPQKFVSSNYKVSYKIKLDKSTYEPKMSLMENDIQFLNDPIASGDTYKAILVFFVPEEAAGECKFFAANGEGSVTSTTNFNIK